MSEMGESDFLKVSANSLESAIQKAEKSAIEELFQVSGNGRKQILVKAQRWLSDYRTPTGDALAMTRTYLEKLKALAIPPTTIETHIINALMRLFNDIQSKLDYGTLTS